MPTQRTIHCFVLLACLLTQSNAARAWQAPIELSPQAQISMLTMYPGTEVHSMYGHTGIRVRDPVFGLDVVFNYGLFDFHDPWFVWHFVHGRLDYMLGVEPFEFVMQTYVASNRSIVEQTLNLSTQQKQMLWLLLVRNAQPENRVYRYDFLRDNCSTRPLDMVERVTPSLHLNSKGSSNTYRGLLTQYCPNETFLGLGINLLLGGPADQVLTDRDFAFLPLELMNMLDHATVETGNGRQPLVVSTRRLFWVDGAEQRPQPTPWPAIVFTAVLILGAMLTLWHRLRGRGDLVIRVMDASLLLVVGLAGVLMLYMALATEHRVTYPNWNLLWAWPTHLVAAVLVFRRVRATWFRIYLFLAAGMCLMLIPWQWLALGQQVPPPVLPLLLLISLRGLDLAGVVGGAKITDKSHP